MEKTSPQITAMIEVVEEAHADQTRNNGNVPYVQHCFNVAEILVHVLNEHDETPSEEELEVLQLIGLGHDLFEDTSVGPDQIRQRFGVVVSQGIEALSNYDGDDNTKKYLEEIRGGSDDTRLIKAADLADNTLSVYYGFHDLGADWVINFYLPIARATDEALRGSPNSTYSKSYQALLDAHQIWLQMLENRVSHPKK